MLYSLVLCIPGFGIGSVVGGISVFTKLKNKPESSIINTLRNSVLSTCSSMVLYTYIRYRINNKKISI